MKKHNPIDELFHRRLSQHDSSVPAGMFDRIQSARQKSAPPALLPTWWMAAAASILLLIVAFFWGYQQGKQDQAHLSHFPIAMDEQAVSLPGEVDRHTASVEHAIAMPQADQTLASTTIIASSTNTNTSAPSAVRETINTLPLQNTNYVLNSTPLSPIAAAESSLATADLPANQVSTAVVSEPSKEVSAVSTSAEAQQTEMHALENLNLFVEDIPLEKAALSEWSNSPKCAKFSLRSWSFDVDLLAGPAYGFHTLGEKVRENSEHLTHRQRTEQPTTSFSTMLRVSALAPSGVALRSGLAFTQLNNRFEYHNENERRVIYRERLDANGNVIDIDTIHTTGARHMVDQNRFRFLEVPLQLGYEFRCGKLKLAVNAGASVNVLFAAQGTFLSPATGEPTAFASSDKERLNTVPAYRTQIGAGLDASVSVRYHLTGRYSLLIEPYVRHYTGSLTEQAYSLSHQATVSGLNLGLRMRL